MGSSDDGLLERPADALAPLCASGRQCPMTIRVAMSASAQLPAVLRGGQTYLASVQLRINPPLAACASPPIRLPARSLHALWASLILAAKARQSPGGLLLGSHGTWRPRPPSAGASIVLVHNALDALDELLFACLLGINRPFHKHSFALLDDYLEWRFLARRCNNVCGHECHEGLPLERR
jgi:hypothetical protein